MWTRTNPGSALVPLVCQVATRAKLGYLGRSSETLHVDPDRPRECFGAISLQSCDARQVRLISNRAA